MKSALSAGIALAASLAFATPSHASLTGSYSVTFNISNGATQCLVLAENGALGTKKSGTWYSSTFPNWGGTFIVLSKTLHLVGPYGSPPNGYTTFDGLIADKTLVNNTFDEFDTTGVIIGAGTVTVVKGCAAAVVKSGTRPTVN